MSTFLMSGERGTDDGMVTDKWCNPYVGRQTKVVKDPRTWLLDRPNKFRPGFCPYLSGVMATGNTDLSFAFEGF